MKFANCTFINCFPMILMITVLLLHCSNPTKEHAPVSPVSEETSKRENPELIYDANGNIIERHSFSYRSDNSIRGKENYYYTYDDRKNLVKETKESFTPDGELVFKNINHFTFNDKNQKTEQKFFSYNKDNQLQQQARNTYVYNVKGELIEEKTYYENDAVKSVIITERDAEGDLKSEEYCQFNKDGMKTEHKKYHYTKYGLERTEDLLNK